MNSKTVLLFFIAAALFAGCASAPKTLPAENIEAIKAQKVELENYYPLAVGNEWSYEGVFVGKKERRTIKIIKKEEGVFFDNGGGKLRFDSRGLRDDKRYLLRIPMHKTNKWISIPAPVAAEHYKYERLHFTDKVKAGVFDDCITVQSTITVDNTQQMTNTVTYAKGVGIIRISTIMHDKSKKTQQVNMELIGYKVGDKSVEAPPLQQKEGKEAEEVEEKVPVEKNLQMPEKNGGKKK